MAKIGEQCIFIVDDDAGVCRVIHETLSDSGAKVSSFTDASVCLDHLRARRCDLLIADLRMPEMDGLELLKRARMLVPELPVLMITGYGDVPSAVEAMKSGAVDFIEKPLVKGDFLREVRSLLEQNTLAESNHGLTRTETRVLMLILAGRSNKQIATVLNRSKRTVETHRAHVMEKLGVDSLVDLVKVSARMGLVDLPTDRGRDETPHASESG